MPHGILETRDPAVSSPLSPDLTPTLPAEHPIELERLKRSAKSLLFGDDEPPVSIGRFEVTTCIGRGGMGIVYAARDVELDRTVAIKVLSQHVSQQGGDHIQREAQALARLSHPNVVGVFDVGTHDGQRFIAMEYVRGQSLTAWLGQPRTIAEVLTVFCDVAQGLHAAHTVGLVHRDFKADNVLVGDDGRPRVLDFGLARGPDTTLQNTAPAALPSGAIPTATCLSLHGELLGTPVYMSPEQHLGLPVDARSDQFSFGVALYDGVFGRLPFSGDDLRALSLAIVRSVFTFPTRGPRLSRRLMTVLQRLMAQRPDDRFASMAAMLHDLQRCINEPEHQPAASKRSSPPTPTAFGTRSVAAVLGRAAELESQDTPGIALGSRDVLDAASEAGLDPRYAQQALAERVDAAVAVPAHATTDRLAMCPPREHYAGVATSVIAARRLPGGISRDEAELMIREIERTEHARKRVDAHGKGMVARFFDLRALKRDRSLIDALGNSVAWSSGDLEVHIDRGTQAGSQITLWRQTTAIARRTVWASVILGAILGLAFAGIVAGGILGIETEAIIMLCLMVSAFVFVRLGLRTARKLHRRHLEASQARLDYLADRAIAVLPSTIP